VSRSVRIPEGISTPRSASGRCSVYFRVSLVNGMETTTVDCAGRERKRCRDVVDGVGGVEG
jgi:hypothetical protein